MITGRDLIYGVNPSCDELYEQAFSEGYEYAQREFASIRKTKKAIKSMGRILNSNPTTAQAIDAQNKTVSALNKAVKPFSPNRSSWTNGQKKAAKSLGNAMDCTERNLGNLSPEIKNALNQNEATHLRNRMKYYSPKLADI